MLLKGQLINNVYEVQYPIGEGGAGQIYLAWHRNLQKQVVVKRIKDAYVGRIDMRLEADLLKRVKHRFITQVYDYVEIDREIYTVMDYIEGNTLADYINSGMRFDEYQVVTWMKELLEALSYLHSLSPAIIHNDIKPSNIMVDSTGHICLIDFNISASEVDRSTSGGYSRGYASPEQMYRASLQLTGGDYMSVRLDARSDLFSFGASFYHLMTGENPVKVMDENRLLFDRPQPYSELLMSIVDKCLRRNPNERYSSADIIHKDLDSMKIRDLSFRRLKMSQMLFSILFVIVFAFGAFMVVKGLDIKNSEEFYAAYYDVTRYPDKDPQSAAYDALNLVNEAKYQGVLDSNPEAKANLLYVVGNSYFELEDYKNAVDFYERTISLSQKNPDFFRDYAIASARGGDVNLAKSVMDEGKRYGLRDADLSLVEAEIVLKEGDAASSVEKFNEVVATADNDNTLGRAYMYGARAYQQLRRYDEGRDFLLQGIDRVASENQRIILHRELGNLCIACIGENGINRSGDYINLGLNCYEYLINSTGSNLNDYINASRLNEITGEYVKAADILKTAENMYPDAYEIPMGLCRIEILVENQKPNGQRDFSGAVRYFDRANELYAPVRNSGMTDPNMVNLEEQISKIR